ncbi:MAG: hypothetical protein E7580_01745 [Ruminococcaceae bacterium]|nr:hypothetical protein [Oscillospiraceae bacterium]
MKNFHFGSTVSAVVDLKMQNDTVKKLWKSFSFGVSEISFVSGDESTFRIGEEPLPVLGEGKEYVLSVSEKGIAIVGKDYGGLMRGFFVLLMKITETDDGLEVAACTEESAYKMENRMIHICVFPENDFYFIKKLIRLSALCQYTHIVIEFWGMLQYDCMKELAWPHAFTKDMARELIRECRELGIEPIPMFNQLGHATASRVRSGKHVVLDQNPRLHRLFTPDGWAWNIASDEVKELLAQVRRELYELFGEGSYMHIGCDEAYFITRNAEWRKLLSAYLAELTRQVEAEGRRPMLWMDMLLEKGAFKDCYTVGESDEVEAIRNATALSSVFVDWQYRVYETPIPSLTSLKDCGRAVMGAPWYDKKNYRAHVETLTENQMHGIMLTTWHTLNEWMATILDCAKECGASTYPWTEFAPPRTETATLLRHLSFEGNTYADAGWMKEQIELSQ